MPEAVDYLTPADLRDVLRAMAVVSLLFEPREAFRDHSFQAAPATSTAIARWCDFAGNRCHFLFHTAGSVILGFDHESPMSPHASDGSEFRAWPGVYESLPSALADVLGAKPFGAEFDPREVTFCLWNLSETKVWVKGDIAYPEREYRDPDGEGYVLGRVRDYYRDFAGTFRETYHWDLDEDAVAELLSGDEITRACVRRLKIGCDPDAIAKELAAMGFRLA